MESKTSQTLDVNEEEEEILQTPHVRDRCVHFCKILGLFIIMLVVESINCTQVRVRHQFFCTQVRVCHQYMYNTYLFPTLIFGTKLVVNFISSAMEMFLSILSMSHKWKPF